MFEVSVGHNVVHKKTGNIYHVVADDVIDCTNASNDRRMVLYSRDGKMFVREYEEFKEKFCVCIK